MSESDTMRGEEVAIGKFKFTMPGDAPVTDAEVIQFEELIAKIDKAAAPFRQIADRAALVKKTLREDITTAFRLRIDPKDDGPKLIDAPGVEMEGRPATSAMSGAQLKAAGDARRKNRGMASS